MKLFKRKPIKKTYYKYSYKIEFNDKSELKVVSLEYSLEDWEKFCESSFQGHTLWVSDKAYNIKSIKSLEKLKEEILEKEYYCSSYKIPYNISE